MSEKKSSHPRTILIKQNQNQCIYTYNFQNTSDRPHYQYYHNISLLFFFFFLNNYI